MSGMHESPQMLKEEWLTPPWLLERLGAFDLDPCAPPPERRPWPTAAEHYHREQNGLNRDWTGRVWLNPPYGPFAEQWLKRLAHHGNGIALCFARTDTRSFFEHVWNAADALLFLRGRLHFYHANGTMAERNCGAASVLVAYGANNVASLEACADLGQLIHLKQDEKATA